MNFYINFSKYQYFFFLSFNLPFAYNYFFIYSISLNYTYDYIFFISSLSISITNDFSYAEQH